MTPLCFVLMPFGRKPLANGVMVDFDAVYRDLIAPAIVAADLEPIRADEERAGGVIHKPMFERLMLCEYAIADLSGANANVFYELGVRHAIRPASTIAIVAHSERLPFDVAPLRVMPYQVSDKGLPGALTDDVATLTVRLRAARASGHMDQDSPLFQLVEGYSQPDIARLKTDVFRERETYRADIRHRLAEARRLGKAPGVDAVRAVQAALGSLHDEEAGVLVDLLLSYRALGAHADMIELVRRMPAPVAQAVMVREQYGFALNRVGQRERAAEVLSELIRTHGPSSETNGLLGRVYKDRWDESRQAGDALHARGWLDRAIDAYLAGFQADPRDAYPGVNAVTLMELRDPPDPRRGEIAPVVLFAARRRVATGQGDYWDHATLLELAVLGDRPERASDSAAAALAHLREPWEAASTANNLRMIREARERRGEPARAWAGEIERSLSGAASRG